MLIGRVAYQIKAYFVFNSMVKTRAKNPSIKKWHEAKWYFGESTLYVTPIRLYHNYFYHNTKTLAFLFNSKYASTQAFFINTQRETTDQICFLMPVVTLQLNWNRNK